MKLWTLDIFPFGGHQPTVPYFLASSGLTGCSIGPPVASAERSVRLHITSTLHMPMPSIFYVQYEARPSPENEDFSTVGGAYVNCYVVAKSGENACELAHRNLIENFWEVVVLEEGPIVRLREHYLDDPEMLECFDEALSNGECYVYHLWPIEPQDGDAIH